MYIYTLHINWDGEESMATVVALEGTGHMCRLCFHSSPPNPCIILHLPSRSHLRPWKETSIPTPSKTLDSEQPQQSRGGNPRSSKRPRRSPPQILHTNRESTRIEQQKGGNRVFLGLLNFSILLGLMWQRGERDFIGERKKELFVCHRKKGSIEWMKILIGSGNSENPERFCAKEPRRWERKEKDRERKREKEMRLAHAKRRDFERKFWVFFSFLF